MEAEHPMAQPALPLAFRPERYKSPAFPIGAPHCTEAPSHHSSLPASPSPATKKTLSGSMPFGEAKMSRGCLLMALRRYSVVVHNMEQTVLLPSLLREVTLDQGDEEAEGSCKDLYECYHMLKAIRNMAESGLVPPDEHKPMGHQALSKTQEPLLQADPEVLFDFHLKGLFSVINNLAKTSQRLTSQYMEIIGIAN